MIKYELDKLLEALNALIIEKNNEHQFTDEEKELLKKYSIYL